MTVMAPLVALLGHLVVFLLVACHANAFVRTSTFLSVPPSPKAHLWMVEERATETFDLAVFPVRKRVRVPTDTINLNLFETRYVELAKFVLSQPNRTFGVLYGTDKPQMIRRGQKNVPVVPIFEPGDVGVICKVYNNSTSIKNSIRRIRLKALAIERMQVESILSDGYSNDENTRPFIQVRAKRIQDEPIESPSQKERIEKLEGTLYNLLKKGKQQGFLLPFLRGMAKGDNDDDDENGGKYLEENLDFESFAPHLDDDSGEWNTETRRLFGESSTRSELLGFAAIASLRDKKESPSETQQLLQMVSPEKRLERILELWKGGWGTAWKS